MRCLATDPDRYYFFCGASINEATEQLLPYRDSLEAKCTSEFDKRLFQSSRATYEQELEAQKEIKKLPYITRTIKYHQYIGEVPDYDIYFVANSQLNELYFVPFDTIYPEKWGSYNPWRAIDKFDFKKLIALSERVITYQGKPYKTQDPWVDDDVVELTEYLSERMLEIRDKGPRYVFAFVYSYFQHYQIFVNDLKRLLLEGNCVLDHAFFNMDQLHMHMARDYMNRAKKEVVISRKRTKEEEISYSKKLLDLGYSASQVDLNFIYDFLDNKIDYSTFNELVEGLDVSRYQGLTDDEIRKKIWLQYPKNQAVNPIDIEE